MCRNIRTLAHFDPPATGDEIHAAALQFVRKISGSVKPARVNEPAFDAAVDSVAAAARQLLATIVTPGAPRTREAWAARAKARSAKRFARAESGPRAAAAPQR